ncbi:MAG: type II toxin-antitoxin system VapC family toxin [Chloroflexi bacterium]|nr:type II toxin-antitoxin system VapC family toxin [Chloroflexota bacterium]
MRLVVDASIVLRWFLEDERTTEADDLLDSILAGQNEALAPPHLRAECFSAMTRIILQEPHRLSLAAAQEHLATLAALPLRIAEPAGLYDRSLAEFVSRRLHPSMAYDIVYLTLAELLDLPLWTGDARFYYALRPLPSRVTLIPSTRAPTGL